MIKIITNENFSAIAMTQRSKSNKFAALLAVITTMKADKLYAGKSITAEIKDLLPACDHIHYTDYIKVRKTIGENNVKIAGRVVENGIKSTSKISVLAIQL
jgi:hypothetical protein